MNRKSTQLEKIQQYRPSENSRKPSFLEQDYKRNSQAGERSSSQRRTDTNLGSSSGTERKTPRTVGKDSQKPSYSQQDRRSNQGLSSSHPRIDQPSWRQARREASVTPTPEKRFSGLNMGNRRSLRGGKEITYKYKETTYRYEAAYKVVEEASDQQKPADTAAADTAAADTAAADTAGS
jgi:hypothetical protein